MSEQVSRYLSALRELPGVASLAELGMGIEKESLRIDPRGHLAQTPHPESLGAPLTHPSITTDFSEALLEFITPVFRNAGDVLAFLQTVHTFTYAEMDPEELLWISSMPCILDGDDKIPLAQYGSANVARLKTLYRKGLSHRYGSAMQTIAGIHFNFSLSDDFWPLYQQMLGSELSPQDFKTEQYFHLIRNFKRYSWLLVYLFGASPAVCNCFVAKNPDHGLDEFPFGSLYAPYGTSLRMGDLGYTSKAQADLYICYNSLQDYAQGLREAIRTPYAPYAAFQPETDANGQLQYKQLNDSILQIENEFYSTIRPKRTVANGKKPVQMLLDEGVEYIEVRCLDLNPFLPLGIDEEQIHFLNTFLLFCLFKESPAMDCSRSEEMNENLQKVVREGRRPGLTLQHQGKSLLMSEWAEELLAGAAEVGSLLDELSGTQVYERSSLSQIAKVKDSSLTPSAKVLERMHTMKASYFRFAMDQSLACSDYFRQQQLTPETLSMFKDFSAQSLRERDEVEAADTLDFDTYLKQHNES